MRRTKLMMVGAALALSLSASGTGAALAQTHDDDHGAGGDDDLTAACQSYNIIEWLLFHHECHGHGGGEPIWPASWF
jgi:hypothetical protein